MKKIKIAFLSLFVFNFLLTYGQSLSSVKIELLTPNANVYLDNVQVKGSNLFNTLTIASGSHTIKATLNGYFLYQKSFVFAKGEHKVITISLEKDSRSTIKVIATTNDTKLNIDSEPVLWDSSTPYTKSLEPGNYEFSFYGTSKFPVTKRIYLGESNEYEIKVNLSNTLPTVFPSEVGRESRNYFTASDFNKPEYKQVQTHGGEFVYAVLGGLLVGGVTALVMKGNENQSLWALGGFAVGAYSSAEAAPKTYKTVPDNENIAYNKNVVPGMVKEKNLDLDKYNQETKRLIEKRQKEKYLETAVKVEQVTKDY